MKRLWFLLAILLIFIPIGVWLLSPKQVIMRRTKHLMEVMSINAGTGAAIRQAKVFSMNAMLAPRVTITAPEIGDANGSFDKQELESGFSWICQNAKSADFRIRNFADISIEDDKATVTVVVDALMELPAYRPADGVYLVTIHWVKGGDGWRFEDVSWKTK